MAKESVSEKLARLKAAQADLYDKAEHLRHQDSKPNAKPEPPGKTEELNLDQPDRIREFQWILQQRKRGRVPAISVRERNGLNLYVYPIGTCRFTLRAFRKFANMGARANGIVAARAIHPTENGDKLLRKMISVAEEDAQGNSQQEGLTDGSEDWLERNPHHMNDWITPVGSSVTSALEAPSSQRKRPVGNNPIDWEVYAVALAESFASRLARQTGNIVTLTSINAPDSKPLAELKRRTPTLLPDYHPGLSPWYLGSQSWDGWTDFHQLWPSEEGISMLSPVGYSDDKTRATFVRFNAVDPGFLNAWNEKKANLEFFELVTLERQDSAWAVILRERNHARPYWGPVESHLSDEKWDLPFGPRIHGLSHVRETREVGTRTRFLVPLKSPCKGERVQIGGGNLSFGQYQISFEDIHSIEKKNGHTLIFGLPERSLTLEFDSDQDIVADKFLKALAWERECFSFRRI